MSDPYVLNELRCLTCNKATGSDGIPNWLLKEYADILSYPITSVLNSSFAEQRLSTRWKNADVIPVPNKKPINGIKNQLRLISLTPSMSKIAEDFVIKFHMSPAVLILTSLGQYLNLPLSKPLFQSYIVCREKQMEHLLLSDLSFSIIERHLI